MTGESSWRAGASITGINVIPHLGHLPGFVGMHVAVLRHRAGVVKVFAARLKFFENTLRYLAPALRGGWPSFGSRISPSSERTPHERPGQNLSSGLALASAAFVAMASVFRLQHRRIPRGTLIGSRPSRRAGGHGVQISGASSCGRNPAPESGT